MMLNIHSSPDRPIDDIRNTRAIALVVARGRTHCPAEMWRLSGFVPEPRAHDGGVTDRRARAALRRCLEDNLE
jgi:hypothetical protein